LHSWAAKLPRNPFVQQKWETNNLQVAGGNSEPFHLASQLLEEERLLALEDKRNQVHNKFIKGQADKYSLELDDKKGNTVLVKTDKT